MNPQNAPIVDAAPRPGEETRSAVVDIGSNSVRLVVFSGAKRVPAVLFNEKVLAGLGAELSETGRIGAEAMERGLCALQRFAQLCRLMRVDEVNAVATAAVREASNGGAFLARAREIGFDIDVIAGKEEALFSANGILSAFPDADGIVGDLGGGSLELARVSDGTVHERVSLPLGVLRARAWRGQGTEALSARFRELLEQSGFSARPEDRPFYLVGGSWRTLARISMNDSDYPLRVVHNYAMEPGEAQRLAAHIARAGEGELDTVPGISSSRLPTMPEAATLLCAVADHFRPSRFIVSAFGLREGLLYGRLTEAERARDPLIAGTEESGEAQARFPANGRLLNAWIAPVFAEEKPKWQRLRQAACNLGDVAWRANPDFRAERGLEIALHGNWVGIDGKGREMLGQAIYTCFGAGTELFPGGGSLMGKKGVRRSMGWGLAMRLGQRLSGGTRAPFEQTRLSVEGDRLVLDLKGPACTLGGEAVEKRLGQLASHLGLEPLMRAADQPQ